MVRTDQAMPSSVWHMLEDFMLSKGIDPTIENAEKLLRDTIEHKMEEDCLFDDAGSYCYKHEIWVL